MSDIDNAVKLLRDNIFCILGTATQNQPWVTPVAYRPDDQGNLYWTSSRQALHSKNIADNGAMSICVIDQTTASTEYSSGSHPSALYYRGQGYIVPDSELDDAVGWRYPRGNHKPEAFMHGAESAIYRFVPTELFYVYFGFWILDFFIFDF